MEALYAAYRDRAAFFVVYIAEAHAVDGWHTPGNEAAGIFIREHRTFEERRVAARTCMDALDLTLPALLDEMDDSVCSAYAAWPDRIYIVDVDGNIAYKGGPGPAGFRVHEAAAALAGTLDPAEDTPASLVARAWLPRLRALRGPVQQMERAVAEVENVVEAWQEADGQVYLRTLFGEERLVPGYIGAMDVAAGRLLLVDSPGQALMSPARRMVKPFGIDTCAV